MRWLMVWGAVLLFVSGTVNFGSQAAVQADEKVQELAAFLPDRINTVAILRVKDILQAGETAEGEVTAQLAERFASGSMTIPNWVDTLVMGALTRPHIPQEAWAAGVLHRPAHVSLESIAEHAGSSIDQLAGRSVITTQRNSMLIDFPDQILGFYRPSHRQEVAEWIRANQNQTLPPFNEYLFQALNLPDDLVLSINLRDMFDTNFVKAHLQQDPRFQGHTELLPILMPLIENLSGVTLSARVGQQIDCLITIDFAVPVGPSPAVVKTFFLAVLEDAGAMIEEFPGTRISSQGNTVELRCQLSLDSMQRLISLIVPPQTPHDPVLQAGTNGADTEAPAPTPTQPQASQTPTAEEVARRNRRYLQGVDGLINDLNRASRNASDYRRTITWHQTFAHRIESLPTTGVRPDFVEYGERTAERLRALASSLRGQGIRVNTQSQAITYEVADIDPGWMYANYWGGVGYRPPSMRVSSNLQQIREQQAAAVEAGELERAKIWDMIRADQADMQRLLNQS